MIERGLWLIVTGTGRCGTGYLAQVLTSVGVNCTHEGVFNPHVPGETGRLPTEEELRERARLNKENAWWGWQAESSWLAAPYLTVPELEDCKIVHLVRHPKRVIDSQLRIRLFTEDVYPAFYLYKLQFLPELADFENPFHEAAYFYVQWNRMIEPHADYRVRVEKDSTLGLLDRLGIEWREKQLFSNRTYNSRVGWRDSDVDLDDLPESLRDPLREMCGDYGYKWPCD